MSEPILQLRGVVRQYVTGERTLQVLNGADLDVRPGEIVGLIGPSGSGKSSLLHAAGLLERPTSGQVFLEGLGLAERVHHQPGQLSGGEQQRVAIARSMANHPKIILADEPTGNLDPSTSLTVFRAFQAMARAENVAALIATHNMDLARYMDRVLALKDGRLVEQKIA